MEERKTTIVCNTGFKPTCKDKELSYLENTINNLNTKISILQNSIIDITNNTETDPIFVASPAHSILSTDISHWNTAYGWGDHHGLYKSISYVPSWSEILNKPAFSPVAFTGSYNDLLNKPTIPAIVNLLAGTGISITGTYPNLTITSTVTAANNYPTGLTYNSNILTLTRNGLSNLTVTFPNYLTSYTETDPIFTASVAKGITSTDVTNWNTAYSRSATLLGFNIATGDVTLTRQGGTNLVVNLDGRYPLLTGSYVNPSWLVSIPYSKITSTPTIPTLTSQLSNDAGFLTSYSETDPTVGSHIKAITTTNISNWNTAFSWGNHAGLYRPITYVPSWTEVTGKPSFATVATSGSYTDLINKPTIPAAQVNSDWNASSGISQILNKPVLSTVAISGSYTDLTSKPTIPAQANLIAGSNITITGSYPNLTIASTATGSADGNNFPSTLTFGSGTLTLGRTGLSDLTVSLDGRYQLLEDQRLSTTNNVTFNITRSKQIISTTPGSSPIPTGVFGNVAFQDANFTAHTQYGDWNINGRYPSMAFWIEGADAATMFFRPTQESTNYGLWLLNIQGRYDKLLLTSDTNIYTPASRTLTINGVTQDLTTNRSWTITTGSTSETDPIFTASAAYNITNTNITNWNTAYGWGNHAGLYPLLSGSYANPTWISSLAYSKITGTPTIPTLVSQLTNDSGFISNITGKITAGTNIAITGSGTSGSPYVIYGPTTPTIEQVLTSGSNITSVHTINVGNNPLIFTNADRYDFTANTVMNIYVGDTNGFVINTPTYGMPAGNYSSRFRVTSANSSNEGTLNIDSSVVNIGNVVNTPPLNTTGGTLYVEGGALKYQGSSGTITTIAPA